MEYIQQDNLFGVAYGKQTFSLWICEVCFFEEYYTGSTTLWHIKWKYLCN